MKKYTLLIAILLAFSGLQAQVTAERYVFASMGSFTTSGNLSFSATLGETLIGTTTSGTLNFLQGYQIPDEMSVGIESSLGPNIQVSVFPNPVVDDIYIQFEGVLNRPVQLQLFDAKGSAISGWAIEVREAGTVSRNIANLASGTYFLQMRQNDGQLLKTMPVIKL
jgi:hypothetical protein